MRLASSLIEDVVAAIFDKYLVSSILNSISVAFPAGGRIILDIWADVSRLQQPIYLAFGGQRYMRIVTLLGLY